MLLDDGEFVTPISVVECKYDVEKFEDAEIIVGI